MKVAVMGYSGAGKSALAQAWGKKYHTPVLHLDTVHWMPGRKERDSRGKLEMISSFLDSNENWVIDGNYSKLYQDRRLREADRIVLLLTGRWRCLWRVLKRHGEYRNQTRPDPGEGRPEKIDAEFIRWVLWDGRTRAERKRYREIIRRFPEKTVVLRSQRQIDRFLNGERE